MPGRRRARRSGPLSVVAASLGVVARRAGRADRLPDGAHRVGVGGDGTPAEPGARHGDPVRRAHPGPRRGGGHRRHARRARRPSTTRPSCARSTSSPTTAPTAPSSSSTAAGVDVRENTSGSRGKGPALQWLLDAVLDEADAAGRPIDAVVIVDADTVVAPGFLGAVAARLEAGAHRRAGPVPGARPRRLDGHGPAQRGPRAAPPPPAARAHRARRLVRPVRQRHGVPHRGPAGARLDRPPHRGHRAAERAAARRRARRLRAGRGRRGGDADDARGCPHAERALGARSHRAGPSLRAHGCWRSPAGTPAAASPPSTRCSTTSCPRCRCSSRRPGRRPSPAPRSAWGRGVKRPLKGWGLVGRAGRARRVRPRARQGAGVRLPVAAPRPGDGGVEAAAVGRGCSCARAPRAGRARARRLGARRRGGHGMTVRRAAVLLGTPIDDVTMDESLDVIAAMVDARAGAPGGCTRSPPSTSTSSSTPPPTTSCGRSCAATDLSIPDGMGDRVGRPARAARRSASARPAPTSCRRSPAGRPQDGWRLCLFGGAPGVAERAADVLRERAPGVDVVVGPAPMVGADGTMDAAVVDELRAIGADVIGVALGNPKQERWIARYGAGVGAPVCIGIGGTLDFLTGTTQAGTDVDATGRARVDPPGARASRGAWSAATPTTSWVFGPALRAPDVDGAAPPPRRRAAGRRRSGRAAADRAHRAGRPAAPRQRRRRRARRHSSARPTSPAGGVGASPSRRPQSLADAAPPRCRHRSWPPIETRPGAGR